MRTWLLVTFLVLCLGSGWTVAQGDQFIMSWDDGDAEDVLGPIEGTVVAAGFQTPSPSARLIGIEMYVCDDGVTNPIDPMMPTTAPFTMYAFKAASVGEGPGFAVGPGYIPFPDWYQYPEGTWLDIVFPSPRDIGDPSVFPGGSFYVGILWMHDSNPLLGVDLDPPNHSGYWLWEPNNWAPYDAGDVLLRAVVSDSAGNAVIDASWSAVKWLYQ